MIERGLVRTEDEIKKAMRNFNDVANNVPVALSDPFVTCFVLSDERRPSGAAMFAFRTKWNVVSIGPRQRPELSAGNLLVAQCHPTRFWDTVGLYAIVVDTRRASKSQRQSLLLFLKHNPHAHDTFILP